MTLNELIEEVLKLLPNASFDEDNDGQIVIYTDLRCENEVLKPFYKP